MSHEAQVFDRSVSDAHLESTETKVAHIFGTVFETADAGLDDDFFELGGDSLLAATLMAAIDAEFGVVLPISSLLETPTPRTLAKAVSNALSGGSKGRLMTISAEGKGPPIFCVHGMSGNATFSRRLAAALDPPRPVYALRASGLQEGELPIPTVEALAAQYLADIRTVRPVGPYIVLGQCGTSMVAYEMAQQLVRAGESVPALIICDPPVGGHTPWLIRSGLSLVQAQQRGAQLTRQAMHLARTKPHLSATERADMVRMSLWGALRGYVPKPYAGRTLLLHSTKRRDGLLHPTRGFPAYVRNLKPVEMNGDHYSMFTRLTGQTATHVSAFLASAGLV